MEKAERERNAAEVSVQNDYVPLFEIVKIYEKPLNNFFPSGRVEMSRKQ